MRALGYGAARTFMRAMRWEFENAPPDLPRYVLIGAPHTSTLDFPFLMAALGQFDLPLEWMGKDSLFRPPFGGLMRRLGGISVDRAHRHNAVTQVVELFRTRQRLVLAIAPEGTRKRVEGWKTGFWHIANQAGVPIVPAYLDAARRRGGWGPPIQPSGDMTADFARLAECYAAITPIHPERFGPVQARPDRAGSPEKQGGAER